MKFTILGIPKPKQSARFFAKRSGDKTFIKSYQKKEVVENERNIAWDVKSQLPKDFVPFDCPIGIKVLFVFPPLKSFKRATIEAMEYGEEIWKDTRPDLDSNLLKGVVDAMNGVVYIDDARICKVESMKVYGHVPRIEIEINKL
jgi:Holliday junction resolvase RusA-like endonuclease